MPGNANKDYYGTTIGNEVESSETGFTSFTIPDTVIYFKEEAFANCVCLSKITIPGDLSYESSGYVESNVFKNCINLTDIYFKKAGFYKGDLYHAEPNWKGTNCNATVHSS